MLRAMDLKTLLTTLAVLGSGASLVACDKGKAEGDKSEDAAKTQADADKADENKDGEDAKEVEAAAGDADKGAEKAKGEMACGEGACGEGTCGGKKAEDEAPKGDSNLAADSNADKNAVPPKGTAVEETDEDQS